MNIMIKFSGIHTLLELKEVKSVMHI